MSKAIDACGQSRSAKNRARARLRTIQNAILALVAALSLLIGFSDDASNWILLFSMALAIAGIVLLAAYHWSED